MKHIKYTLLIIGFLFSSIAVNAQADLKVEVQQQTNWCWAANSKCIFNYYNIKKDKEQCDIVNWSFSKSSCCRSKSSCNQMNNMGPIYRIIANFGELKANHYRGPMSKSELEKAHEEKRPYIVGCMWRGGNGGHVVVGGAFENGRVTVMDPWRNNGIYTFRYNSNGSMSLNGQAGNWQEGVEVLEPFLSVDEAFKKDIKLYPTAVKSNLNIELAKNSEAKTVAIYNVLGKEVTSKALGQARTSLDLSNIASGVYFAKIKDGANREATFKFVKK